MLRLKPCKLAANDWYIIWAKFNSFTWKHGQGWYRAYKSGKTQSVCTYSLHGQIKRMGKFY